MRICRLAFCVGMAIALRGATAESAASLSATLPTSAPVSAPAEQVYRTELASFPGAWGFQVGKPGAILVSDEQLEALADPDRPVNLSLSATPHESTLRQICERARAANQRTLIVAFDHFFAQYRPGQGDKPRRLTPDMDAYVQLIARISRFIESYGLGLELSLLSPLEIGPAYAAQTGEHGVWMHYRKGVRDPQSGAYSVQLWRQTGWANNKGPLNIEDAGVRVFAFRQQRLHGTPYIYVDPKSIVDISSTAKVEVWPGTMQPNKAERVRVYGTGEAGAAGLDHVLVVQMYKTPEMDYFSEKASAYLHTLLDKYIDAGVKLNALYSDEMHIQQDWDYHNHHDHGQFALRYVSPGLTQRFAAKYGAEYADFARYLIYFCYGQEDTATDLSATDGLMHVFAPTPEGIAATALFRSRYYKLLQDGVVDLFTDAKHYAERRLGHRLEARAHATWAESPACDVWRDVQSGYEYTPGFVWSNTVQQAASACHDYFKWGDFLTGNGNDHAEGGYLDRNYTGLSLAASTGMLNEVPYSYAAHWGMPGEIDRRRHALVNASGASAQTPFAMVEGMQHRDISVLMLYPLDLVATEERFGSWINQYGYANYVTQAKLLERGRVHNGAIEIVEGPATRRFTTLVAGFEPFAARGLLEMMRQLTAQGGRVIWSGPPPMLATDGTPVLAEWQEMFGADYAPDLKPGIAVPGQQVAFEGELTGLPAMTVLTDFLVDRIYPVGPRQDTQVLARIKGRIIGTQRKTDRGGRLVFLGFRPRDDQSASLGYEARWWFEILDRLGAYSGTGMFAGMNDNTEHLSRTTDYLVCRFVNGTTALAPHLRRLEECWPGGFARDAEKDKVIVAQLVLPSEQISLTDFQVNGQKVSYTGQQAVAWRIGGQGELLAFCGAGAKEITIDGRTTQFAENPMSLIAWAPIEANRRVPGGAVAQILVYGAGKVQIPMAGVAGPVELVAQGPTLGSRGAIIPSEIAEGTLRFTAGPATVTWLYVVPKQ